MKIFVTGASGYIGSAVAAALQGSGHDVIGLVRSTQSAERLNALNVKTVIGVIQSPETYRRAAEQCSLFIHAAADYTDRLQADRIAIETFREIAARRLLMGAVIYTSGVWIYGDTGRHAVDESAVLRPPPYVAWRREVEQLVLETGGVVVRPGCVFGGQGGLTANWFEGAVEHNAIRVVGNGLNHWAMVHIDDLADAYVRLVNARLTGTILNITDRSRLRVREMVESVAQITQMDGPIQYIPTVEAVSALGTVAECLALDQHIDAGCAALLGWSPQRPDFVTGVEEYLDSWKCYYDMV